MTSQHVTEAEPTLNQLIQSIEEGLPISAFKKTARQFGPAG